MQNEPQALLQKRRPESTACRYRRGGTWCEEWVDPLKRLQEKRASAKHRAGKQEGKAV